MKKLLQVASTTVIGGLFFLAPLVLLLIVFSKAVTLLQKITQPMMKSLEQWTVGGIAFHEILAVILLLLLCLAAGLFARTAVARSFLKKIETGILVHLPGYEVMKTIMGDQLTEEQGASDLQVVLAQTDAGWQLGFLIETVNDNLFVVFIPNAPSLRDGAIVYAEKDKVRHLDITRKEAIRTIRRMGAGSATVFKGKL
ncbi:DUF502 domain-containing protein [Paraflavitalea pollutisoli]|uniref:DUF502 domain-containing protein n=1 Tax=Paraflavitalea pollutisoli TaxID=3034143 RepID=UPI0023EAE940|nr:DUF502 domain-containing protein [Paraflavitalea sp. H1-2-19X]